MPLQQPTSASRAPYPETAELLLVEDDREMSDTHADALRRAGFLVTQVFDGVEAWKRVLTRLPHVVVTKLSLAGIDGFELCRRLRSIERTARLPVITIAGLATSADHRDASAAGFDCVLTASCEPSGLANEVRRASEHSAELRARFMAQRRAPVVVEDRIARTAGSMARRDPSVTRNEAERRIRADYGEMPGLRLTARQGARLWDVTPDLCVTLLEDLVAQGFLSRSGENYGRR